MGRPTDYLPAYCEQVKAWGKEGRSKAQIADRLDVARQTLDNWAAVHPEFLDALTRARDSAQAWFEDKGQDGLTAPGFNASLWAKQVSCRFREDYTEKTEVKADVTTTITAIERRIVRPED